MVKKKGGITVLNESVIRDVLSAVLKNGGDFAELFFERKFENRYELKDGKIEQATSGEIVGVGIRGFLGTKAVYAYTNDLSRENLINVAKKVGEALEETKVEDLTFNFNRTKRKERHVVLIPPAQVEKTDKVSVMKKAYYAAKNYSELIKQVVVWYWDYDQEILVANSEGTWAEDRRVRTRLMINAVAEKDGVLERGFYGPGAGMGFEFFDRIDVEEAARKAARIAARMVEAEPAPAEKMTVVIANGFGGVIFHEAVGHGLEATSVAKGASVFAGKLGQKVAAECVSAVDDATIPNGWGSANVDDEGTPTQRTLLIDKGVLVGYLVDKLGARRMGMKSTGSGRRQDYTFPPTSRMSNTFILPGDYHPEEIIAATEYGLYAKTMGGGSVNPATGEFNFAVSEAYLIEKERITKPVRGATLIGKGHEIIQKIDMVGNDLARDQGMCGSFSGSVPADVGQPTIRVKEIVVGGRNK